MKELLNLLLITLGVITLSSCGCGRTIVDQPVVVPMHMPMNQVQICRGVDNINVPDNVKAVFEKELRKKLYGDNLVKNAPGIQLQYRFVQFNEGNRFARYFFGGIGNTGEASVMVEVIYLTPDNFEIGRIHTEGKISSGLFGGSCDNAIEKAAAEVACYTRSVILHQE